MEFINCGSRTPWEYHSSVVANNRTLPARETPMGEFWQLFLSGQLCLVGAKFALERCFVSLRHQRPCKVPTYFEASVVERVLTGEQPKVVAAEFGISTATVSQYCRNVLDTICNAPLPSRAPLFVIMAALGARGLPIAPPSHHGADHEGNIVLSVDLPGKPFRARLTAAEWIVACALIEGKTHAEICTSRNTSPRTVANQLNAVFRKVGVSGRSELVVAALLASASARSN